MRSVASFYVDISVLLVDHFETRTMFHQDLDDFRISSISRQMAGRVSAHRLAIDVTTCLQQQPEREQFKLYFLYNFKRRISIE